MKPSFSTKPSWSREVRVNPDDLFTNFAKGMVLAIECNRILALILLSVIGEGENLPGAGYGPSKHCGTAITEPNLILYSATATRPKLVLIDWKFGSPCWSSFQGTLDVSVGAHAARCK